MTSIAQPTSKRSPRHLGQEPPVRAPEPELAV